RGMHIASSVRLLAPISIRGKARVTLASHVVLRGKLVVSGDGRLSVGARSQFGAANGTNRIDLCDPQAEVIIGQDCFVNGARIAARARVEIGNRTMLGDCRIMDSDFHSVEINRHEPGMHGADRAVVLSENVWVGNSAIILKGVSIGENSVVGAGAVVSRTVPPNVVVAGNPAIVVKTLCLEQPSEVAEMRP